MRLVLGDDRFEDMELMEPLNEVLAEWSLWNNLFGAQRRLLRKERGADGKVRMHHEKRAATPCARLLGRADLDPGQRARLEAMLAGLDPFVMRAGIERKLAALYARRAVLREEDGEDGPASRPEPTPRAGARGKAGGGSTKGLQNTRKPTKKHKATVSPTVRHRAIT